MTALAQLSQDLAALVARAAPSVVGIEQRRGQGSGLVPTPDGYVLTNEHVVRGAQRIQVVVPGIAAAGGRAGSRQRIFEATVVGAQPSIDLALLKVNASGLPTLPLTGDAKVRQGEIVFAVGSPQGLASTVTMGVVSAAARQIDVPSPLAIPMLLIALGVKLSTEDVAELEAPYVPHPVAGF